MRHCVRKTLREKSDDGAGGGGDGVHIEVIHEAGSSFLQSQTYSAGNMTAGFVKATVDAHQTPRPRAARFQSTAYHQTFCRSHSVDLLPPSSSHSPCYTRVKAEIPDAHRQICRSRGEHTLKPNGPHIFTPVHRLPSSTFLINLPSRYPFRVAANGSSDGPSSLFVFSSLSFFYSYSYFSTFWPRGGAVEEGVELHISHGRRVPHELMGALPAESHVSRHRPRTRGRLRSPLLVLGIR